MNERSFTASLLGVVNAREIKLSGEGTLDPKGGITDGKYTLESTPKGFDPHLYGVFLITGYPQIALSRDGATNPFSGRTVSYKRVVEFENGGEITFDALCKNVDGHVESTFVMSGNVDAPDLVGIEPLVETWIPAEKDKVIAPVHNIVDHEEWETICLIFEDFIRYRRCRN